MIKSRNVWFGIFVSVLMGAGYSINTGTAGELQAFYAQYKDDDNLSVMTPVLRISETFFDASTFNLKYAFERFDKKAPTPSGDAMDAISGATTVSGGSGSGFSENRHEVNVSASHIVSANTYSWSVTRSVEQDFSSFGVSAGITREMLQKNVYLATNYGLSLDSIVVDQLEEVVETKQAHIVNLSVTQLLSPTSLIATGYELNVVTGYQSNPLRKVIVVRPLSHDVYDESHPDFRQRHNVFVRAKQYFTTRSALELNSYFYKDDWAVSAYGAEAIFHQYLSDKWVLRLRYLIHHQTAADFYKDSYTQKEDILTADRRLRPHNVNLRGLKLIYRSHYDQRNWEWSLAFDQYRESNDGLLSNIAKLSIQTEY